jgi:hypothetical protein
VYKNKQVGGYMTEKLEGIKKRNDLDCLFYEEIDLGIQLLDNKGNYRLFNNIMDELEEKWNLKNK